MEMNPLISSCSCYVVDELEIFNPVKTRILYVIIAWISLTVYMFYVHVQNENGGFCNWKGLKSTSFFSNTLKLYHTVCVLADHFAVVV